MGLYICVCVCGKKPPSVVQPSVCTLTFTHTDRLPDRYRGKEDVWLYATCCTLPAFTRIAQLGAKMDDTYIAFRGRDIAKRRYNLVTTCILSIHYAVSRMP